MAATKPSGLDGTVWASSGSAEMTTPTNTEIQTGWQQANNPPVESMNYLQNLYGTALKHINGQGVPLWDTGTSYAINARTIDDVDGRFYRAVIANSGVRPSTDSGSRWTLDTQTIRVNGQVIDLESQSGNQIAFSGTYWNNSNSASSGGSVTVGIDTATSGGLGIVTLRDEYTTTGSAGQAASRTGLYNAYTYLNGRFSSYSTTTAANAAYAPISHTHNYAATSHSHNNYVQTSGNRSHTGLNLTLGSLTATTVTGTSDKRLKTDIVELENALEKLTQLSGYAYKKQGTPDYGLIAQEVRKVLPHAVIEGEDGLLSVNYFSVLALVVEAIKELKELQKPSILERILRRLGL